MARPSKLTPERQEEIANLIRLGNFRETAAQAAGIHPGTLRRWIERGEQACSGRYSAFCAAIKDAEAQAEAVMVGRIREAARAPKHWTAAAWYLERKHPERWGRRRLEITGPEGDPIELRALEMPVNRVAEVLNVLNAAGAFEAERARQNLRLVDPDAEQE